MQKAIYNESYFPLSTTQEQILQLVKIGAPARMVNLSGILSILPELDIKKLNLTSKLLIEKHPALRLSLIHENGHTYQKFNNISKFKIKTIKTTNRFTLCSKLAGKPFNLEIAPLFRIIVINENDKNYLFFSIHHIICDGVSLNILLKDFIKIYEMLFQNKQISIIKNKANFADYVHLERAYLKSKDFQKSLNFWKKKLNHFEPTKINLANDKNISIKNLTSNQFFISKNIEHGIKNFCIENKITTYDLLLTCWSIVLKKYSENRTIYLASAVANRSIKQFRNVFMPTRQFLLMKNTFNLDDSFLDHLEKTKRKKLSALRHQRVPYANILNLVLSKSIKTNKGGINTAFSFLSSPRSNKLNASSSIERAIFDTFELSMYVHRDSSLKVSLQYDKEKYQDTAIQLLINTWLWILSKVIDAKNLFIRDLVRMTEFDKAQILKAAQGKTCKMQTSSFYKILKKTSALYPNKTACSYKEKKISYKQLDLISAQLAHALYKEGVRPGHRIAVLLDKDEKLIIALWAIFKLGATFIPLPAESAIYSKKVIKKIKPSYALVKHQNQNLSNVHNLNIKTLIKNLGKFSELKEIIFYQKNIAYIYFTSGSTGQPKAIPITYLQLLNKLHDFIKEFKHTHQDVFLSSSRYNFDIVFNEIITPHLIGAALIILPTADVHDIKKLEFLIKKHQINIIQATPTLWKYWINAGFKSKNELKIFSGGEMLDKSTAKKMISRAKAVWNLYGPTETTIWATAYNMTNDSLKKENIPIGKPLYNTQVYILNHRHELCLFGKAGEIYIGGNYISQQYIGDFKKTNTSFIKDFIEKKAGHTLYKTGDYGKLLPDGNLIFLGRKDQQVKYLGNRIELLAIEKTILSFPFIENCVVILSNLNSEEGLVAFYQPKKYFKLDNLQIYLKQHLRAIEIPNIYIKLKKFPVNQTGKIDRSKIKNIDLSILKKEKMVKNLNQTQHEEEITQFIKTTLNLSHLSLDDNLFFHGLYSLTIAKIISNIEDYYHISLSFENIINNATPRKLAKKIPARTVYIKEKIKRKSIKQAETTFTNAPLDKLISEKRIEKIDAIAIDFYNELDLQALNLSPEIFKGLWLHNRPILVQIDETEWGRNGYVLLPYSYQEELIKSNITKKLIINLLNYAKKLGVKAIYPRMYTLYKNFPFKEEILKITQKEKLPQIIDDYPITSAVFVLNCISLSHQNKRDFSTEHVSVLGLGYIGYSTIVSLLTLCPHPKEITLCDFNIKKEELLKVKSELIEKYSYKGKINIALVNKKIPNKFYRGSYYITAVTTPNIIDISQLQPNSILCDISSPSSFSLFEAKKRQKDYGDIYYVHVNGIKLKSFIKNWIYIPQEIQNNKNTMQIIKKNYINDTLIPCTHMALLFANYNTLKVAENFSIEEKVLTYIKFIKQYIDISLPEEIVD